jgi:dihydrodiol dehydrogenase / D-xylose 1-dehydrogenase (NADP)
MFHWGIMGSGSISHQFAAGLKEIKEAKLYAVASASGKNPFGIKAEKFYSSYEELAKDPNVDAVYIGTIHPIHLDCVKVCLENKKPVLCEKPIAINERELDEMIQLAKENNTFFMEAMWSRYLPVVRHVKEILQSGVYGRIHYMNITFGYVGDKKIQRLFEKKLGGGSLLDIGVYGLNLVDFWLGETPEKIHSWAELSEEGVDVDTSVQLTYKSGVMTDMMFSFNRNLPNSAYIMTDKAELEIPYFWRPEVIVHRKPNGNFNSDLYEKTERTKLQGNGYQYEAMEVMRCIKEGLLESSDMTWEKSREIMQQMDCIRKQCGVVYPQDK